MPAIEIMPGNPLEGLVWLSKVSGNEGLATVSTTVGSATFLHSTFKPLKRLEHRMGFEPMNTGFAVQDTPLFQLLT